MEVTNFPMCCTALIISNFGGTAVADGACQAVEERQLTNDIMYEVDYYARQGKAMLVATTNNQQVIANKVLKATGFRHTKWMSKGQHPETKVRMWWKELA